MVCRSKTWSTIASCESRVLIRLLLVPFGTNPVFNAFVWRLENLFTAVPISASFFVQWTEYIKLPEKKEKNDKILVYIFEEGDSMAECSDRNIGKIGNLPKIITIIPKSFRKITADRTKKLEAGFLPTMTNTGILIRKIWNCETITRASGFASAYWPEIFRET